MWDNQWDAYSDVANGAWGAVDGGPAGARCLDSLGRAR